MTEDKDETPFPIEKIDINSKLDVDTFEGVELRERVVRRKKLLEYQFVYMAKDLFDIFHDRIYKEWGYETFSDYLFAEVGYTERTAKRYVELWRFYLDLLIQPDQLVGIGFGRAEKIKEYVTRDNADDWFEKARTFDDRKFNAALRAEKVKRWPAPTPKPVKPKPESKTDAPLTLENTLPALPHDTQEPEPETNEFKSFSLFPEQKRFVESVLLELQHETGSSKEGYNLVCALQMMTSSKIERGDDNEAKPKLFLKGFELRFGGKVIWLKSPELVEAFMKFYNENINLFEGSIVDE